MWPQVGSSHDQRLWQIGREARVSVKPVSVLSEKSIISYVTLSTGEARKLVYKVNPR